MAESGYKLNKEGKPLHTLENWKQGGKSGDNPWLNSDDLNWEGWKNWGKDFFVGQPDYDFTGLPEGSTYKDYMFELQRSRQPENYNNGLGKQSKAEESEILADINRLFPNRKKDDGPTNKGRNMRDVGGDKYGLEDKAALARAALSNAEKAQAIKDAEAEAEAEYRNSFKGRLDTLWEDGSKRNAILSGISETLLETRTGADAYGNRFRDLPKNVSDKMMQAEALDMVKDQAMLDMIKTQAETQAAMDPRQFLSNTQKNARDFASAQGHVIGSKEWNDAYAGAIQEMTMENLLTAPVEGIAAISEMLARNTGMFDEQTVLLFKDVVSQLTSKIQGEPIGKSRSYKKIIQGGTD